MKCEFCKKRNATIHIEQIIGNEVTQYHICPICAHKKGISADNNKLELSVSQLLTGIVSFKDSSEDAKIQEVCPKCGMKIEDFRKDGIAGCSECYEVFKDEIKMIIKNLIGSNIHHKGKVPKKLYAFKTLLIDKERLKIKLKDAVDHEDYEAAAAIRDRIKDMDVHF